MKSGVRMNIKAALDGLEGRRLLCAVSGGADSMCLLHLLWSGGYAVTAAHFEHGIRGEESLRDACFVGDFCRDRHIPFVQGRGDTPSYAREKGLSTEEAARELRYAFLFRTAEETGADCILTAHTLDDNAETVLFNLARGSGAAGLAGIPRQRGLLRRPLLDVSRAEIEAYLAENAVPHVEDSSNRSDDYTRNLIRHRIVPALREINPRFAEAAARSARLAAQDEDCLASLAAPLIEAGQREGRLSLAELRTLHPAVASRVVRGLFPGLSMERAGAVLLFLRGSEDGVLELPGRRIRRGQGQLWLTASDAPALPARRLLPGLPLALPEAGLSVIAEDTVYRGEIHDLFKTSFIKYEMIHPDLFCGGRAPGDRIRPHGRGCTKTLSALFKEAGIPLALRGTVPILRDAEGPLLVRGLAIAERAWPAAGDRVLKIRFLKN